MSINNLSIGSDMRVTLSALRNTATEEYVNDATVTGKLWDANRTTTITTFGLTPSGDDGDYTGTIAAATTADLVNGRQYKIQITAVSDGTTRITWDDTIATYH